MANERLAQARALIKAKQYQQARRTLTGVDHPTARTWLAKLDELIAGRRLRDKLNAQRQAERSS